MKEFIMLFRADYSKIPKDSPEEMQAMNKKWMDWIGGIEAQNISFERGKRLTPNGKIVRANGVITDGPYAEIKETVNGHATVKVESIEDAVKIAKVCPILTVGGNVEIREIDLL
ncbi:MAG: YciI family protein [Bacteroidetes bacterium]|nr:YciI family protein [Bacteroidota bacterium]